ncbi:MAG: alpha/beta hydrolase [Myxococcales bacterium]|nr:alpha/beta hydrolase [Myxococcales bacterium]
MRAYRRTLEQVGRATFRTASRRLRRGPRRPSWSFRYETLVELLRIQFGVSASPEAIPKVTRLRKAMDRIGEREVRRDRVVREELVLGGVAGVRVLPKHRVTGERLPTRGTVLYLHGGAYALGSTRSHLGMFAGLAHVGHVEVVGVDYRLAPEHPCPAAIEDALRAYEALLAERSPQQLVIAGDSAGGGLTAATLVALRDAGLPMPAGGVLISPWTDLSGESSARTTRYDYIFPEKSAYFRNAYAGALPLVDPRVSPVHAELRGLPPLLVLAGEVEAIVDDARRFAARARDAGVEVELHVEPDEIHVYPLFADLSPRAQSGMAKIARFVHQRTG